jgi:integration host factor subunit alpha
LHGWPKTLVRGCDPSWRTLKIEMAEQELNPGLDRVRIRSVDVEDALDLVDFQTGDDFTLTKAELAEMLFDQVGLNKREAKDMVETFFGQIRAALESGEVVKLSGFGNFQLRDKPQRPGRNPKTGEAIPISARRVVTFHASQKLKAMVDDDPTAQG